MKLLRFVFPFLFVRNWHNGQWEVSPARMMLFVAVITLIGAGIGIAYMLQAPVVYVNTP